MCNHASAFQLLPNVVIALSNNVRRACVCAHLHTHCTMHLDVVAKTYSCAVLHHAHIVGGGHLLLALCPGAAYKLRWVECPRR